jgi:hypothetical protein
MSVEDIGKYFFLFSIEPPVKLSGFVLPSDMKFDYNKDSMATSLEVSAYGNLGDVKKEAIQRVKKLVALLSLQGVDTTAVYGSLYKLLPNGAKAFQVVITETIGFSDSILPNTIKPIIDVTEPLSINDVKFWRQMGHYYRGKSSKDPIERYREFYLVLEDEGSVNATERALRHAVNHPKLDATWAISKVTSVLGSTYFDPMNQKHIDAIKKCSNELQEKAKAILIAKTV